MPTKGRGGEKKSYINSYFSRYNVLRTLWVREVVIMEMNSPPLPLITRATSFMPLIFLSIFQSNAKIFHYALNLFGLFKIHEIHFSAKIHLVSGAYVVAFRILFPRIK